MLNIKNIINEFQIPTFSFGFYVFFFFSLQQYSETMTATHQNKAKESLITDGLPNSFIQSMSTLFDIMDDRRTGYIKFTGFNLIIWFYL